MQLATAVALGATAAGWIGWAIAGPTGNSRALTPFVCWTGVAGSVLLIVHPVVANCWFAIWACVDAGAAISTWIGPALVAACGGILAVGYLARRVDLLATLAAVSLVAYVVGLNRRRQAGMAMMAERGRIAAELHDILAHSLTALAVQIQAANVALDHDDGQVGVRLHLKKAEALARSGQEETVAAVRTLRDGAVGLHDLIGGLVDASGVSADLAVRGIPRPLGATTGMAAYRLLQEALTNAGKHSPGGEVSVALSYESDALDVTVENRVLPTNAAVSGGHGLAAMRERITQAGGTLEAGSAGDLWRVYARLPA